ncbi:MAG: hypothetical protein WC758_04255 [Candidatus Woesearchaeota archaeon]
MNNDINPDENNTKDNHTIKTRMSTFKERMYMILTGAIITACSMYGSKKINESYIKNNFNKQAVIQEKIRWDYKDINNDDSLETICNYKGQNLIVKERSNGGFEAIPYSIGIVLK